MPGRYRIDRLIGEGGSAEVFEASVVGAGGFVRRVALKRLKATLADDAAVVAEFEAEARLASRLHHANVVAVLDYGTLDGLPFQILEHVDGPDLLRLESLIKASRKPAPPALWVAVAAEAAHGLEYVHHARDDAGRPLDLVHRDVTPSNVLIAWSGDVKLADFGIAFSTGARARTRVGVVKGKLEYLSPEQLRGEPVDARTDVFALGCVLHRLLSGRGLMEDEATRRRVAAGEAPAIAVSIPTDIARLIGHATQPEPSRRIPTAAAFADACARWLAQHGVLDGRLVLRETMAAVRPTPEGGPAEHALAALMSGLPEEEDGWGSAMVTVGPHASEFLDVERDAPGPTVVAPPVAVGGARVYTDITDPDADDSRASSADVSVSAEVSEATRSERDPSGNAPTQLDGAVGLPADLAPVLRALHDTAIQPPEPTGDTLTPIADGGESAASDTSGAAPQIQEEPVTRLHDTTARKPPPMPYDVIEPFAEGGFAVVYRARNRETGEIVALKLLRHDRRDHRVAPARFEREAAALQRISSPYLVRLIDSGRLPDGRPWLAMDLLHGRTLSDEIQAARGPLAPARVRRLARDIALGLAALHEANIVHRDIGARNVLVVETGGREKAMIIDLGHARWTDDRPHTVLTRPGLMLGNARWMAPEQVHEPSTVGPAADLYSLGLLMLAMLTGRAPFLGSPRSVLEQQLDTMPEVPPGPFAPLIRRLIEKDPARRLSSATAAAAELTQIVVPAARIAPEPLGVAVVPPQAPRKEAGYDDRTVPSPPRAVPTIVAPAAPPAAPTWRWALLLLALGAGAWALLSLWT